MYDPRGVVAAEGKPIAPRIGAVEGLRLGFVREAKVQREALGMAGVVPVVIPHPLSSLTDEQIRARAAEALPQVIAVWQGRQRDSA